MIAVHPGLFVGDQADEAAVRGQPGWFIVHACKEPFHREAVGYSTPGAPQDHPEFLIAHRPGRLALNLIDAPDPAMIRPEIVDAAVEAIAAALSEGLNVLIHCNQGRSRSPTIAMLYLARHTDTFAGLSFNEAAERFSELFPAWAPAAGMAGFVTQHFPAAQE